jgi:hypothetical protein
MRCRLISPERGSSECWSAGNTYCHFHPVAAVDIFVRVQRGDRLCRCLIRDPLVEFVDQRQVHGQRFNQRSRQHGNAVLGAFSVAHKQLVHAKVQIEHAQTARLKNTQAASIQKLGDQRRDARKRLDDSAGFTNCQHRGEMLGLLGRDDIAEPRKVQFEHFLIQKQGAPLSPEIAWTQRLCDRLPDRSETLRAPAFPSEVDDAFHERGGNV